MTIVAFFDIAFLATLPGRTIEPAAMDCHGAMRTRHACSHTKTSGSPSRWALCVRTTPTKATLGLCDRFSNPLIEVDAVVHKDCPYPTTVCDLGYGIAPGTVLVEDYTWFEAFSEEGYATGIACTPALHMQSERKTIDERSEG